MFASRPCRMAAFAALALSACTLQHRVPNSASPLQSASPAAGDNHMAMMSAAEMAAPVVNPGATRGGRQGHPGLPASANAAAARIDASPRHAEWVKIAWEPGSQDSLMAWVVYPVTARAHSPVVVVVHEIFGLSTWVRAVADQAAAEGFIAIAPDLLSRARGGPSADELKADSAVKLIRGVSNAEKNMGVTAAARYAMSLPSAEPKYAVIGFCWGGATTWQYATNEGIPGFSGGVAYYGLPYMNGAVPNADSLAKIRVPVMLLSGAKDARIGAAMPAVDSAMHAMGKDYFGRNYPGAIHGFMRAQDDPVQPQRNPEQEQANLEAAKDAWPRTVAFLKLHLGIQ
ncbi:MAG: dienelactone hydrolase family protein [Gemmatimonadaceae bacterium]|nr:dienelactone hydrolase family protein [Gemmatimonadaceae bacterium]